MNTLHSKIKSTFAQVMTIALAVVMLGGCDQTADPDIYEGPSYVKFTSSSNSFTIQNETETRTIEISVLTASDQDRTFTVVPSDTSANTATEGVEYTLGNGGQVTIPADSISGELTLEVDKSALSCDTRLFLELQGDDVASFNNLAEVRFVIYTPFDIALFPGTYEAVYPWWSGSTDPYNVAISSGSGTNELIISGLIVEDLNSTFTPDANLSDYTIDVPRQDGWVSGTYGQVVVEGSGDAVFDVCNFSFTIDLEHIVPGVGTFGSNPATLTKVN